METVAIVRISFHDMNDLILTREQYEECENDHKVFEAYSLDIEDVKSISHEVIQADEFPDEIWEG